MARIFSLVIASVILLSCSSSQIATGDAQSPPTRAEAEVREASDRFWSIRSEQNASLLAETFTESGLLGVPGVVDAVGRTEVRELLQKMLAGRTTDFKLDRREVDVHGDTAYELGWFSEISHLGDGDAMQMSGRYVIFWERERDSQWRVNRFFYAWASATPIEVSSE